jgi:hypothetical protein
LSLASTSLCAGESSQPLPATPSLKPLLPLLFRSGLGHVSTSVTIAYDREGNVLGVKLDTPTGSRDLDKAILAWAARIKLAPGEPGISSIPIRMSVK